MQITTEPLLVLNNKTYMVLKSYKVNTGTLPIKPAAKELSSIIKTQSDANATWGYFPELTDNEHDYTSSKNLAEAMRSIIVKDPSIPTSSVNLAFVRLATSEPESTYGGFHVDVSPGIAHTWKNGVSADSNILRILFNVYDKPRKLEFYPYTAHDLQNDGFDIPASTYKILSFPESLKTKTIEIPAMTNDTVYCLQFFSNIIPHAGRTYADGHFLVSFGGYISPSVNPFVQ